MKKTNICFIGKDSILGESLQQYFSYSQDINVGIIAEDIDDFIDQLSIISHLEIDIVLLSIGNSGMSVREKITTVNQYLPKVDIVAVTSFHEYDVLLDALCAGACSYIFKGTPLLKVGKAIDMIRGGGSDMSFPIARKIKTIFWTEKMFKKRALSLSQKQIIENRVEGMSYIGIADKMKISLSDVHREIQNVIRYFKRNIS